MGSQTVLVERDERVAIVTMNRPERLNALNPELEFALVDELSALATDGDVGCVVLTGAGRGFCAGGDMKATATREPGTLPRSFEDRVEEQRYIQRATSLLYEMRKPTIAMVNGPAAGAGLSLAMACDVRVSAESARFGTAFMKVGFSGDYGGTWLLTHIVGTAKARELYFSADVIDAQEALRVGLVNRVVADAALREQTLQLAQGWANGPRIAYGYIKENLNLSQHGRLEDLLLAEARWHQRTGETQDHREAARAFVEKRPPQFSGR